jgi:diacylglycerol kinase family enzyme
MKAVLFHNPKAGKKGYGKDNILAALKLADHSARYVSTKSGDFKEQLEKADADFVVVGGGDGTVAEVIAHLGNRKLPIGILPMGTANNIARSLAIAGEPQILVETWRMDRTLRLDVALAQGPWGATPFVEAFGVGLLPDMILKASKTEKEKGALNLKKGRELLSQIVRDGTPLKLEIMVDSKKLDGEWLGVEVMNIPYTGPGLQLAPKADYNDGLLEAVCFEKEKTDELCRWFEVPADKPPPAMTRRGRLVTLTWRNAPHRIDDEAVKAEASEKLVTLHCGEEPALILESRLDSEKNSSGRMAAAK